MDMKNVKSRIATALMAVCLAVQSIIPTYAITTTNGTGAGDAYGTNGTGSGETSTWSTAELVGSFHAYHVNQGIRLSIVNTSGIAVSTIVDIVHYFPEDIGKMSNSNLGTLEDVSGMWRTYKKNSGSNKGELKQKIVYLGGSKTDPVHGYVIRNLNTQDYGVSETEPNGIASPKRSDYSNVNSASAATLVEGRMYTYSDIYSMLKYDAEKFGYANDANSIKLDGSSGTFSYTTAAGEQREVPLKLLDPVQEGVTDTGVAKLNGTGETFKQQLMAPVRPLDENGNTTETTLVQRLLEMAAYDVDGVGKDKSYDSVKMFTYLDPNLEKQYEDLTAQGVASAFTQVFRNNGLRLMVEPLHWRYAEITSPLHPDTSKRGTLFEAAWCPTYCLYATTTEAMWFTAQMFNAAMKNKYGDYLDMPDYNDYTNYCDWLAAKGIGVDWDWGLGDECYMLAEDQADLGLYKYEPGGDYDTYSGFNRYFNSLGYGVMVTRLDETNSGTPTWDSTTYPSDNYKPGPAPRTTNEDGTYPNQYPSEGGSYGTKDHKFNIVKFYAKKNADGTYQYIENYSRSDTIHSITINDEPGYEVDGYFTSSECKIPTNKNDSYDTWKSSLSKGSVEGNKAGYINIPAESSDTTLYIRLVEQVKVIKVYETSGTVDKIVVEIPNIQNNTYTVVTPDNGYDYKEGTTSENGYTSISRWDEAPKTNSTTSTSISVPDEIKTIYLHYTKDTLSGGLVLHENEISHNFTSLGLVDGTLHEAIRQYNSVSAPSCPYEYNDEDDDTCGARMNQTDAGTYSFTIDNKAVYNKQFVYKWNQLTSAFSGEGPGENGGTRSGKPDMEMTLSRVGSGDVDGVTTVFCSHFLLGKNVRQMCSLCL
jgi:hypothetical protein